MVKNPPSDAGDRVDPCQGTKIPCFMEQLSPEHHNKETCLFPDSGAQAMQLERILHAPRRSHTLRPRPDAAKSKNKLTINCLKKNQY